MDRQENFTRSQVRRIREIYRKYRAADKQRYNLATTLAADLAKNATR